MCKVCMVNFMHVLMQVTGIHEVLNYLFEHPLFYR